MSRATPVPKAGKKDKTSPKSWRPVENFEHTLAKPLERLVADRLFFDAENLGFLEDAQYGGRPSHSTQQAVDGYIHRVRSQLDEGNTVSTLFYDLKGAFNRISHRVVVQEMASLGYSRRLIRWVASFLHLHRVTVVIDGVRTVTFICVEESAPQGSALSVIVFLLTINRLLRRLKTIDVFLNWRYGFVDDTNFSTASKSPSQNCVVLNQAAKIAVEWSKEDEATFESSKTELLHHSPGYADLSEHSIVFDGMTIHPSEVVKWIGVRLDSKLTGGAHIESRAASASRSLNASLALTHAVWGLKPLMIRDLVCSIVLPRADYGVSSFFPLSPAAFKPLDGINKCVARCITGGYRTAARAALEKEAALLPAALRLERSLLQRLATYLTLPPSHGITPLLQDAISRTPKRPHRASALHYVERLPAVRWPPNVPERGSRLSKLQVNLPTEVTTVSSVDPNEGYGARGKRGGVVTESCTRGLPPPLGGRQVIVATPSVSSAHSTPAPMLGMERIEPVYLPPWADPLPVNTVIPSKPDAVAVLEELLREESFSGSTWYTDGSLLAGAAGGAAVLVVNGEVRERFLLPLGDGQVAEGEMEGLLCATKRALVSQADHILIVSDSQAALRGIQSTRPRAGQHRAIAYDKLIRTAMQSSPGLRITNLWTPAHIGTLGNEFADDAAKAATLLPAPSSLPVSLTTCKRKINTFILERWCKEWATSTLGRGLREIDDSPPSVILRSPYTSSSATRAEISIISQLRTDFSALNAHRFRCRLVSSPACDACGASQETRAHYLLFCPAWSQFRAPLQAASFSAGILGAVDIRTILNHPKLIKPLVEFMRCTGRFT